MIIPGENWMTLDTQELKSPPEGLPGVEEGPGGRCLKRRPGLHRPAGAAYPQRGLAGGQGPHGGGGPGSPLRHAHVSPYLCDPPVSGQRRRHGNRPGATRARQHQDHHDLCEGDQGGQGPGCGRSGEGLSELATESCIWCELASTTPRKSRSSAGKCCESLTNLLSTTEFLAPAWPIR